MRGLLKFNCNLSYFNKSLFLKTLPSLVILFTITLTHHIAPVSSYSPSSLMSVSSPSSSLPSAFATLANFFFVQSLFQSSLTARSALCTVLTTQRVRFERRNKRASNRIGDNDKQLVVKIYLTTQLWMGISQHTHTVTTTEVSPDLGELAEIIDGVSVEMIPLRYH